MKGDRMVPEYRFVTTWRRLPASQRRLPPVAAEALPDALFDHGYTIVAQAGPGRCGVGAFQVWQQPDPPPGWPPFALEIQQLDAESVVWIDTLPHLWDFLARYGQIGYLMMRLWAGDEGEGEAFCDDCQTERHRAARRATLHVLTRQDDDGPAGA
jgi:hypothetical protein